MLSVIPICFWLIIKKTDNFSLFQEKELSFYCLIYLQFSLFWMTAIKNWEIHSRLNEKQFHWQLLWEISSFYKTFFIYCIETTLMVSKKLYMIYSKISLLASKSWIIIMFRQGFGSYLNNSISVYFCLYFPKNNGYNWKCYEIIFVFVTKFIFSFVKVALKGSIILIYTKS